MSEIAYYVVDRFLSRIAFPLIHPSLHRRNQRARAERLREAGPSGLPAGRGMTHTHISTGLTLHFGSVCGVGLDSIGGPMRYANCRRCIRIAKRVGVWGGDA